MKSITEAELLAGFAAQGMDRYELQERLAAALGIPKTEMGTVEQADAIIGGPWPTPMRGAQRHQCEACDGYVSLAPSSQAANGSSAAARRLHGLCDDRQSG